MSESLNFESSLDNFLTNLSIFVSNNNVLAVQSVFGNCQESAALTSYIDDNHLLFVAAAGDFIEIGKLLIQANANVNLQQMGGCTPLSVASSQGSVEFVRLLLAQPQIEVDLPNNYLETPLFCAAECDHLSVVKLLLAANAVVDSANHVKLTALQLAAGNDNEAIVSLLLRHKADVNHRNDEQSTALGKAAQFGCGQVVPTLLAAKADASLADVYGTTPLILAAVAGHLTTVRELLAANANVNDRTIRDSTALQCASFAGRSNVVDELLAAKADTGIMTERGWTALMCAAMGGHAVCVKSLVRGKADVDLARVGDDTPLLCAIENDRVEIAKFLLQNGADRLKKGKQSARQTALGKSLPMQALFQCSLCGSAGMCCKSCRKTYCLRECDQESDCKWHEKIAHQAVVEWALAMASLHLSAYVLEHIFDALKVNSTNNDYQQRVAIDFLCIPASAHSPKLNVNFFHLIVEERSHSDNIAVFICVQNAFQNRLRK